jgi:hypothetical protein
LIPSVSSDNPPALIDNSGLFVSPLKGRFAPSVVPLKEKYRHRPLA